MLSFGCCFFCCFFWSLEICRNAAEGLCLHMCWLYQRVLLPRQLKGCHLIGLDRRRVEFAINVKRTRAKNIKTSLPPGACSVMASQAGSSSVLEELFWGERQRERQRESGHLVISSDGKQHPATTPIYQAQMRCQGSTAIQRVSSPFLHRLPICHHKWGKQHSPGILDTQRNRLAHSH